MVRKMIWPVTVTAATHRMDGRRVSMRRVVEGAGDAEAAMLRALQSRRDKGRPFLGDWVTGVTPLGQVIRRVFDPDTGKLVP